MIRAFFFDLDGTLMDSEVQWVEAVRQCMADRGLNFSHEEAEEVVYGNSWEFIYEDLGRRFPVLVPELPRMAELVRPYFERLCAVIDVRVHGSIRLLKRLAETHPVAIVSGSYRDDIAEAVQVMEVAPDIAFFLGKEDYAPGKPHPACYRMAAERLGLSPAETLVFEDSTVGIEAAKEAGAYCVALTRPGRPRQDISRADWSLEDLDLFTMEAFKNRRASGCATG